MEETKIETISCDQDQLAQELRNIDRIQKTIADMQAHIKFLMKRQTEEEKKIDKLYNMSVKMAASKIIHAASVQKSQQKQQRRLNQHSIKSTQIRQIRENNLNLLKQTRLQVSRYKETQSEQLKEMSRKNDEKIKSMKEQEKQRNKSRALLIKRNHMEKIQQIKSIQQQEKKQKQEEALKQNLSRINRKAELQKQIQKLEREQQSIKSRLEKQRYKQLKIKETAKSIITLDTNSVLEKSKVFKKATLHTSGDQPEAQVDKIIEKSLFQSALVQLETPKPQNIMFFR